MESGPKGHWQRAYPATAASIGSNDQEPPGQVIATHAYRASTCQKQAHHKSSTGHGIANCGSAPRVRNTSMTPGITSGAQPMHCFTTCMDGIYTWPWRTLSDGSHCPLRVLCGSSVRHSTTNPMQLATAALLTTPVTKPPPTTLRNTPGTQCCPAARHTNQTRDLTAKHEQLAKAPPHLWLLSLRPTTNVADDRIQLLSLHPG